jgi:tetratricopeptide (TPR) repeat protein
VNDRKAVVFSVLAALLVMAGVVAGGLVHDAAAILQGDPRFELPIDWSALITQSYWLTGLWRPLTLSLFGLQVAIPGDVVPAVFHTVSLALYVLTVAMVVRFCTRLGVGPSAALVVGLLFAVHPLHVEVVASVVGQAELLTAIAMIGAATIWHRAVTTGAGPTTLPLLLLAQAAAIGAKEQGFVLPVLLLGQHLMLPKRLEARRAASLLLTVGLFALLMLVTRALVTGSVAGETPLPYLADLSLPARWLTALGVLPEAVRLLFLPLHLQGEYGPPALPVGPPWGLRHALGVVVLALALLGLIRWWRRRPIAALGLWWIAVSWLPASSILAPTGALMADRLLFLPTIGLALVVAAIFPTRDIAARKWLLMPVTGLMVVFAARTMTRVTVWRSPSVFYQRLTVDAPRVSRAWYVRGLHERDAGDLDAAEAHLRQSLALWDREPVVQETLGQLLRAAGRCDEAVPIFRDGLSQEPTRTQLRARLGECLLATGDSAGAAETAREGIALGQEGFSVLLRRAGSN